MKKTTLAVFAMLLMFSTAAQTPPLPATHVSSADIQAFIGALPRNKISDLPIRSVDVGGYHVAMYGVYRPKGMAQEANQHLTKVSEIYYILDGSGTLVTGGAMPDAKPMAPGSTNLQSPRIEGGVSRKVAKGDVVIIPGRTPHWFSGQDADLSYLIFRPDPEGKIPLK